jgi:predicted TIM-barrel fold metal-dependent hydrolase
MRIDAHVHFLVYNPGEHLWVTDELGALKGTFLPGDLETLLRGAGFDGCVAVEAGQLPHENDWRLDLGRLHASIKGVVGWVDLCAPDVTARLEALAVFLASEASGALSGRLISAVTDDVPNLPTQIQRIMASDAFTLRRVDLG